MEEMDKDTITMEDGRYLLFYQFGDGTPPETQAAVAEAVRRTNESRPEPARDREGETPCQS